MGKGSLGEAQSTSLLSTMCNPTVDCRHGKKLYIEDIHKKVTCQGSKFQFQRGNLPFCFKARTQRIQNTMKTCCYPGLLPWYLSLGLKHQLSSNRRTKDGQLNSNLDRCMMLRYKVLFDIFLSLIVNVHTYIYIYCTYILNYI